MVIALLFLFFMYFLHEKLITDTIRCFSINFLMGLTTSGYQVTATLR